MGGCGGWGCGVWGSVCGCGGGGGVRRERGVVDSCWDVKEGGEGGCRGEGGVEVDEEEEGGLCAGRRRGFVHSLGGVQSV